MSSSVADFLEECLAVVAEVEVEEEDLVEEVEEVRLRSSGVGVIVLAAVMHAWHTSMV